MVFSLDCLTAEEDDLDCWMGGAATVGDFCPPINVLTGDGAAGLSRGLEPDMVLRSPPKNPPGFFLDSLESVDTCLCLIAGAAAWDTELKLICGVLGIDGAMEDGVSKTSDS